MIAIAWAAGGLRLVTHFLDQFGPIDHRNAAPLTGNAQGNVPADPLCRPRHNGYPSGKAV